MSKIMRKYVIALGIVILVSAGHSFLCAQEIEPEITTEFIELPPTGKFVISAHFGQWSLNPLQKLFEGELIDSISDEIRDEVRNQANSIQPGLVRGGFDQSLILDSSGNNFGLEIRYYPKGKAGSFSLGFSIEKTKMRLAIAGPLKQEFTNGSLAEVEAEGYLEMSPITTNLSLRWDFVPKWIISPYFVFGLGVGSLNGDLGYTYKGSFSWAGPTELLGDSDVKTFKEAEEEMDFNIPNIFLVLQMNLGLRAVIMNNFVFNIEAGFWDGVVVRGGLGFRF